MQIIEKLYKDTKPLYPIERFCPPEKALFIDIETTGLRKETTSLYLIGCGMYTSEGFSTKLLFADNKDEEADILSLFSDMLKDYTHLFHFNGTKFDIPYLTYKGEHLGFPALFEGINQIDIYKMIKPLRYLLFPESMKQKSVESFLGISREDKYNGKELIDVYNEYVITQNEYDLELLITHNREDVLGMHLILPILCYLDLKDACFKYSGYTVKSYTDYNGDTREEVVLEYTTDVHFPVSFAAKTTTMYVKAASDYGKISIRLPIYSGEMKLYFDNYRDYCYLPDEDTVILKELAHSLPKDRYQKATRQTCYQKVSGRFVKQPGNLFTPVLRTDLKDKKNYFRFPDSFKKEAADEFGRQLINIFFTMKKRI